VLARLADLEIGYRFHCTGWEIHEKLALRQEFS
jgi:hypothetical protein